MEESSFFECLPDAFLSTNSNFVGFAVIDYRPTDPTIVGFEICTEIDPPDEQFTMPSLDIEGAAAITSAALFIFSIAYIFRLILKQMRF